MKKNRLIFILLFTMIFLMACSNENHSIQFGKVSNQGKIALMTTLTDEENYARLDKILKNSTNISVDENDLDHLRKRYIQLTNDRQSLVLSNYIIWTDTENSRYICYPYREDDGLYYEVKEHDYKVMTRIINQVKASTEKINSNKAKVEGTAYKVSWTYSD